MQSVEHERISLQHYESLTGNDGDMSSFIIQYDNTNEHGRSKRKKRLFYEIIAFLSFLRQNFPQMQHSVIKTALSLF